MKTIDAGSAAASEKKMKGLRLLWLIFDFSTSMQNRLLWLTGRFSECIFTSSHGGLMRQFSKNTRAYQDALTGERGRGKYPVLRGTACRDAGITFAQYE